MSTHSKKSTYRVVLSTVILRPTLTDQIRVNCTSLTKGPFYILVFHLSWISNLYISGWKIVWGVQASSERVRAPRCHSGLERVELWRPTTRWTADRSRRQLTKLSVMTRPRGTTKRYANKHGVWCSFSIFLVNLPFEDCPAVLSIEDEACCNLLIFSMKIVAFSNDWHSF